MTTLETRRWLPLAALAALCAASPSRAQDEAVDPLPLRLTAFAVNMSGGGRAGTIDITIERWSTDQEREMLRSTLIESGPDKLMDALQKIKPRAGYIRTSTSLGWDVYFARETPTATGGKRVILATDRPMGFWELRNSGRSTDYEFTLAEIRIGKDGKGEGKLATAAKISYNKDSRTVEIENYGIEPVRLNEVRVQANKKKDKK